MTIASGSAVNNTITTTLVSAPRYGYRYYKMLFPSRNGHAQRINEIQFYSVPAEALWENVTPQEHDAVTVSDGTTIDLTLTGQDLSAD